ncbi:single-strand binding protein [Peptoanaerobacter stomatis]|uniref:Single-stranded DNA-binding protein n=1 Tax=Peptoanaerobacter stomatis TaxID=796937 RepID=J6HF95_9FIRM|nr:single-stranded DNA-binding protein [Peptoanaerobacter stomatis]EHL17590.1 single-strand binding protein [Peptoanaerobacter stomatis]EJU23655.1 single-stranded DNA-binding protein [Peptoanaerobacter stomatis]NWO24343.1 single-stranded DNA-binding protein [Peptostreptococcaceae bacterium oral taxon 081]
MNTVIMIGRLTRDPELRYIASTGNAVTRFSIAVDRAFAAKDAEVTADFFNIVVWGKRAETCANYLAKGRMVAVRGRLQNNNYTDKNGVKQYSVEIIAEDVQFIDWGDKKTQTSSNNSMSSGNQAAQSQKEDEFMPEGLDEEGYRALSDDEVPF